MQSQVFRFTCICLLSTITLTGCASSGSEFVGTWVNTNNPKDRFKVIPNGHEYLIVGQDQKPGAGAIYKDGALEVKGVLLSLNLTYVKRTDTILAPGFLGQVEYKRAR